MTSAPDGLFSRNSPFISPSLQQTLDDACIFAAGAGLSSGIAVLACRTGFGSFILADSAQVERSHLNRHAFFRRHIGASKAAATAELLRDIRPDVAVTILPHETGNDGYRAALDRANIIINTIDHDNPVLFTLAREARARGIPMLMGLNLGWGGAALTFTADSMSLEDFLGLTSTDALSARDVSARLIQRVIAGAPGGAPPYLAEPLAGYQSNSDQWPFDSGLGVAASLTAAMVVRAALALTANEPVLVAPDVMHVDLRALLEPSPPTARVAGDQRHPAITPAATKELLHLHATRAATTAATASTATTATTATAATTVTIAATAATTATVTAAIPDAPAAATAASAATGVVSPASPASPVSPASPATGPGARFSPRTISKKTSDDFRVYLRSRQQNARYTRLAAIAAQGKNLLYLRKRPSGLWAYAIRHDMLSEDALNEFGEFRMDQYALVDLYDTAKIAQRGYRTDPTLTGLADHAIHVIAGTNSGQVLACCSIIPPKGALYSEPTGWLVKRRRPLALGDEGRALFPSEMELFGRGVFESLPAIQQIPVERMREIGHLMRNQVIKSPLTGIAVFEVCYALTEVLTNPGLGVDIALGNMGPEARNLMEIINIPTLYAPWAQVVVAETPPEEDFWMHPPDAEGFFWPFVIPTADLQAITPFRQQLNNALDSPAHSTRSAMIEVTNLGKKQDWPQPQFVLQAQIPQRWFVAPPYGPPILPVGHS